MSLFKMIIAGWLMGMAFVALEAGILPSGVIANEFAIHFGSYKSSHNADQEVGKLKKLGYPAFQLRTELKDKGIWYRVYVGSYPTRSQAQDAAHELRKKRIIEDFFIRPLPKGTAVKKEDASETKLVVVGNSTTKRYHLPGMRFYNQVRPHHRVLFTSEEEAMARGYYKAGTGPDEERKVSPTAPTTVTQARKEPERRAMPSRAIPVVSERQTRETASVSPPPAKAPTSPAKPAVVVPSAMPDLPVPSTIKEPLKLIDERPLESFEFPHPDDVEWVEPESSSELYRRARTLMKVEKYAEAIDVFKSFIEKDDTTSEWGQRALRHMAESHYRLGLAGNRQHLLIAIEFYKNTLESFPDPRRENSMTYYRMANTYEALAYYPEAIMRYQDLIAKYPDSPYVPEAHYKLGRIAYLDGKYPQAADALIRYLVKYRGGPNAKQAFYTIAHAYYKANQSSNAEIWFRDAQKKWPSLIDVPEEIILDLARHKTALRRFDEAAGALSFYANLYPEDEKMPEVLAMLADTYRRGGQVASALAVYNQIIDRYPGTRDALTAIVNMATLGVEQPKVKMRVVLEHAHYYHDPINAFDTIIMEHPQTEQAQNAMIGKARALAGQDQKRRAADVYLDFLNLYPQSNRVSDASRGLKAASAELINEYYAKGDHLAVAYIYFQSFGSVALREDEYNQVEKIASSLKHLGFMDDYLRVLYAYLRAAPESDQADLVRLDIASGLIETQRHDEAARLLNQLSQKTTVRKNPAMQSQIRERLAQIAFRSGNYAQAVADYGAVVQSGAALHDPGRTYVNYARSLTLQNQPATALQTYLNALKIINSEGKPNLTAGLAYKEAGDLYRQTGDPRGSVNMYTRSAERIENPELRRWSRFLLGQTYLDISRAQDAQVTFNEIKAQDGADAFWTTVVDFYLNDRQWWEKYGPRVNR